MNLGVNDIEKIKKNIELKIKLIYTYELISVLEYIEDVEEIEKQLNREELLILEIMGELEWYDINNFNIEIE